MSDCLVTYRCSDNLAKRIEDTYSVLPRNLKLPKSFLLPHVSEADIFKEATEKHLVRLRGELEEAKPEKIVTLGNAALRVLAQIVRTDFKVPQKLSSDATSYGIPITARTSSGHVLEWFPLAHPAAPRPYQDAHQNWKSARVSV